MARSKSMTKKNKRKQQNLVAKDRNLRRIHRSSFLLNEKEKEAVELYCSKYKIRNKSKFMREAVLRVVMEQFLDDYPTLFDKQDLDRLIVD